MERPDLSTLPENVRQYIEYLEAQLQKSQPPVKEPARSMEPIPAEPPGPEQLISISRDGIGKRTPRHTYERQHRAGMGVLDLEVRSPDHIAHLLCVLEDQPLLLFTDRARAFRIPQSRLVEAPIRGKGDSILDRLPIGPDERIVSVLPVRAAGYIAFASATGGIRVLRHHIFGEHMRPGTAVFNTNEFGPLSCACWTPGNQDVLMVSRNGMAIRFSEKAIPPAGGHGMRLAEGDEIVAVTPVDSDSSVFIVNAEGKGTIRLMSGFAANKTLGGSGKIAMRSNRIVAAFSVEPRDDIFLASRAGKIIRFPSTEVPSSAGPVQGVVCMGLRSDEVAAAAKSSAE